MPRSSRALQESEQRFKQLVDVAQEGIWVIDAAGKFVGLNHEAVLYDPEALVPFGPKPVPEHRWFESKGLAARLFIMVAGVVMNKVAQHALEDSYALGTRMGSPAPRRLARAA